MASRMLSMLSCGDLLRPRGIGPLLVLEKRLGVCTCGPCGRPMQRIVSCLRSQVEREFRNGCRSFFGVQGHDEHAQRSDGKGVGARFIAPAGWSGGALRGAPTFQIRHVWQPTKTK